MEKHDRDPEQDAEEYEAPHVEDLDAPDEPLETAAGQVSLPNGGG